MFQIKNIGILGGGAWGVTIASLCASKAKNVYVFTEKSSSSSIANAQHTLSLKFNAQHVEFTDDTSKIHNIDLLFIAVPSKSLINVINNIHKKQDITNIPIVICSKGFVYHQASHYLISEYLLKIGVQSPIAVLSGPNFAEDLMAKKPTQSLIGSKELDFAKTIQATMNNDYFYAGISSDIDGMQVCGASKNIYAIGAGILKGLDVGDNCSAAFLSSCIRELYDIVKFGFNGIPDTVLGPSGSGDLILTCSNFTSRNTYFGYLIANGTEKIESLISKRTIEGYDATKHMQNFCIQKNIDAKIIKLIFNILYNNTDCRVLLDFIYEGINKA
ncbi:MAG: NAD(P)-binding domain-containing protein [Proteobacteria bacterium]|nr:NAD(P)-binding domain-containing protein [Pseudomonadota bacterium]